MEWRTDLAIERQEILGTQTDGIETQEDMHGNIRITRMRIVSEQAAERLGKGVGLYITIGTPPLGSVSGYDAESVEAAAREIASLLPEAGGVLVIGLGNTRITPDALGPRAASAVLATRHITRELADRTGLGPLREVSVLSPGVLGQTGMETGEIIRAVVRELSPAAVITVDALASARLDRLGCTVQMTDTGITPGSGVGNARARIDRETTGVPVISIGIPTVVDALTLAAELTDRSPQEQELEKNVEPHGERMIVTPREIDLLVEHAAKLVGLAIGRALQPHIPIQDMLALTAE
ncbi:MAG TPA: GPR endopeptidase [Candidatus Onthovicinus excrementipullorum]|nr:GPR endopeptidase [Candidatus Onthovicinus excrementipullorum]